jgi:hypothetical protein
MSHRIVDLHSRPIKGACAFDYKGHRVSLSTVFHSHDVAIFWGDDSAPTHDIDTAEDAIAMIDRHEAANKKEPTA